MASAERKRKHAVIGVNVALNEYDTSDGYDTHDNEIKDECTYWVRVPKQLKGAVRRFCEGTPLIEEEKENFKTYWRVLVHNAIGVIPVSMPDNLLDDDFIGDGDEFEDAMNDAKSDWLSSHSWVESSISIVEVTAPQNISLGEIIHYFNESEGTDSTYKYKNIPIYVADGYYTGAQCLTICEKDTFYASGSDWLVDSCFDYDAHVSQEKDSYIDEGNSDDSGNLPDRPTPPDTPTPKPSAPTPPTPPTPQPNVINGSCTMLKVVLADSVTLVSLTRFISAHNIDISSFNEIVDKACRTILREVDSGYRSFWQPGDSAELKGVVTVCDVTPFYKFKGSTVELAMQMNKGDDDFAYSLKEVSKPIKFKMSYKTMSARVDTDQRDAFTVKL